MQQHVWDLSRLLSNRKKNEEGAGGLPVLSTSPADPLIETLALSGNLLW